MPDCSAKAAATRGGRIESQAEEQFDDLVRKVEQRKVTECGLPIVPPVLPDSFGDSFHDRCEPIVSRFGGEQDVRVLQPGRLRVVHGEWFFGGPEEKVGATVR